MSDKGEIDDGVWAGATLEKGDGVTGLWSVIGYNLISPASPTTLKNPTTKQHIQTVKMGAVVSCIQSVFRTIGACLTSIVSGIGGILMAIINGIVSCCNIIINFLTCGTCGRRGGRSHHTTTRSRV
ncbi:hypothetical protein CkaCkLH20_02949 [Colletotrichum karsti]|uniref:Uncharacterized protein n=1 Tax=Colletotrichum karsti TaxID=1095194 RepID=A0A9P6LNN4_9PEZI|nr:uncharacterized protein CkaCkLH20_02949 [Colletotrichum karsti]KAF9879406.1 hypothetical protein CkaCkLH20_02949 [Colletotrichum karsti]